MEYQHKATVWNYETGDKISGVFKTRKEAEDFALLYEGHEKSYSSEMGTQVYGIFYDTFNVSSAHVKANEWINAIGGVDGRD